MSASIPVQADIVINSDGGPTTIAAPGNHTEAAGATIPALSEWGIIFFSTVLKK